MLGKKQITAKNAKQTKENRGFFLAFLVVTMQFMGAISDAGKQLQICHSIPTQTTWLNTAVKRHRANAFCSCKCYFVMLETGGGYEV